VSVFLAMMLGLGWGQAVAVAAQPHTIWQGVSSKYASPLFAVPAVKSEEIRAKVSFGTTRKTVGYTDKKRKGASSQILTSRQHKMLNFVWKNPPLQNAIFFFAGKNSETDLARFASFSKTGTERLKLGQPIVFAGLDDAFYPYVMGRGLTVIFQGVSHPHPNCCLWVIVAEAFRIDGERYPWTLIQAQRFLSVTQTRLSQVRASLSFFSCALGPMSGPSGEKKREATYHKASQSREEGDGRPPCSFASGICGLPLGAKIALTIVFSGLAAGIWSFTLWESFEGRRNTLQVVLAGAFSCGLIALSLVAALWGSTY
jgi:hypothetical protein